MVHCHTQKFTSLSSGNRISCSLPVAKLLIRLSLEISRLTGAPQKEFKMSEHQRHANSNLKALDNFENLVTDKVTKSVRESIGVSLRDLLEPLERAGYNRSTSTVDKERNKTVKEEPTTPRSRNNASYCRRSSSERQNDDIANWPITKTSTDQSSLNQNLTNSKVTISDSQNQFNVRCNLRISIPNVRTTSMRNRRVYTMDCDDECEKYADGEFENCYESSLINSTSKLSDDEYSKEKCNLQVSVPSTPYQDRQVYVMPCSGNCGKYCVSQNAEEMFENHPEFTDVAGSLYFNMCI